MTSVQPMLAARDLGFGYDPKTPILERWNAEFSAGELTAITGPSGRGKSTLLYLLGLMLGPTSGRVAIRLKDQGWMDASVLRDRQRAALRASSFGFVFQDAALDPTRTVLDNVIESSVYRFQDRREAIARAMDLLENFGVRERATAKPGQVSGGQAQRIALARALLNYPAIILADEPTGNLDPTSTSVVVEALRTHAHAGACVILVTHDPSLAVSCDRVVSL